MAQQTLTSSQTDELLQTLQSRFESHMARHAQLDWPAVEARLRANPSKLAPLALMESSGGEPDVFGQDADNGELLFMDFSAETPEGRRALCYDRAALDARKANKPKSSVLDVANEMGVSLLSEEEYRALQALGEFDQKTSSWVLTPPEVRSLGGALFCDRRFGRVFTYHNGADAYYSARGFRASLKI